MYHVAMTPRSASRLLPIALLAALLAGCPAAPSAPLATTQASPAPVASDGPAVTPASVAPTPAAAYEAPRITPEEAKKRIDAGEEIVIVDVRNREPYQLERLAGAISAPWADVRAGFGLPPKDKLLLLYCT